MPHKRLKTWYILKLGKFLELIASTQFVTKKANFDSSAGNLRKTICKAFHKNLISWICLQYYYVLDSPWKHIFISNSAQITCNLCFLHILVFQETLRLIFNPSQENIKLVSKRVEVVGNTAKDCQVDLKCQMQELGVLKKDVKIVIKNYIPLIDWMYYVIQIKFYFKEFFSTYDQTRSYFRIFSH